MALDITLKMLPEYRVAYHRHVGPYSPELIGDSWEKIVSWAMGKKYMTGQNAVIGVAWDNPELCTPETCRYDAAVEVPDEEEGNELFPVQTLDEGMYAVARVKIQDQDFYTAWEQFFSEFCVLSSGYVIDQDTRPAYEIYHSDGTNDPNREWDVELCLPVKDKAEL